ncbi:recombinase RecA [Allorhizobium ampelinum]|uniref:recombinase RecA n=1 Tax=Allorhizobium ampelinum TaxID=3025782 RepID=UPI000B3FEBD2|nr:recombinase RecA [Allorhizobium ampelinum]NTA27373.1 recombinase RecA [Allorhizobium ampelinum]OVE94428.1 hypothetical protein B7W85_12825 [Allorhizobium ampelinum]
MIQFATDDEIANPNFEDAGRVHDWRNYIRDELRLLWHTFTPEQRRAIALSAEWAADREEWD